MDDLGSCDDYYYWDQCVYLKDGLDDRSCIRQNCFKCNYAIGRRPYCKFAMDGSCTYYDCTRCDYATSDNHIVKLHENIFKE